MTKKQKVSKYIQTHYSDFLKKEDEWIKKAEKAYKSDEWPKAFKKCLENTLGIVDASIEILTGQKKHLPAPKVGQKLANNWDLFQEYIIGLKYRYIILNMRSHKIVNPRLKIDWGSPLEQLAESLINDKLDKVIVRGFIPHYVDQSDGMTVIKKI